MFKDKHLPVRKFSKVSFFLSLSFLNCGISSLCISLSFIILNISDREHSLLGEGSLYGMSPVLIVWIDLLHYVQETTYFLCWSSPVLLNWRPAVQWSFPQRWVSLAYSSDIYLRIPVVGLCAFQPNGSTSNPARINRILVAHSHKTYYAANTQ